jgi:hypothetical protein
MTPSGVGVTLAIAVLGDTAIERLELAGTKPSPVTALIGPGVKTRLPVAKAKVKVEKKSITYVTPVSMSLPFIFVRNDIDNSFETIK